MAKCPHCKAEIDYLMFHEHNAGDVRVATEDTEIVKKGELAFNYDYAHRWTDYSCPTCRRFLFDTAERASSFLK